MDTNIPKSGPKDVFLHLLAIVTLYASVISFIALLWQYVNTWFPDPLSDYYPGILNAVRWSAAVLIVMFPVYVLVSWIINKEYKIEPARREIRVRKWLTYLTLFISAVTVIVDVVVLVYNLFGGDYTTRFLFKVLAVLITGAAVFVYYYWDMRKDGLKNVKLIAWIVSVVVLATVVGAFFVVGSPAKARKLNFDNRRESDLSSIQSQLIYYWQQKGVLPSNLTELNDSISGFAVPMDPETNHAYEYKASGATSFQLCATFDLPSINSQSVRSAPVPYGAENTNWTHGEGKTCFDRTIDPQLHKPIKS